MNTMVLNPFALSDEATSLRSASKVAAVRLMVCLHVAGGDRCPFGTN
jgi:hypothetical protein